MSIKSFLAKQYARYQIKELYRTAKQAEYCQEIIFEDLINFAKQTFFGKSHNFSSILTYDDFKREVPIRDYEDGKRFYELVKQGKSNILWPGKPLYFAKTSGTTSGSKYIPITRESINNHLNGARNALLCSIYNSKDSKFVDGKMIFLSGSPELTKTSNILTGRLSGIVNHHIPKYLKNNQVPTWETNCIEDWEEKIDAIVEETKDLDMTLISGIPPWVLMYFEKLLEVTGKPTVKEVFPNFDVFVYGGVNFEPYRATTEALIGGAVKMIETFPASEGFFAFKDKEDVDGLLLNVNSGIFFEFVPADEIHNEHPTRLQLKDVELGKNYALIISNNAGLWAYNIGDTVKFVSKQPYRIVVTGRTKHFISAFGEHVISEEVETALLHGMKTAGGAVTEFHVAPFVSETNGESYHEWFLAFEELPHNMESFATAIDNELQQRNSYYKDLRDGHMLKKLVITPLPSTAFRELMKQKGKLGGQNKVPRLANDRQIASELETLYQS